MGRGRGHCQFTCGCIGDLDLSMFRSRAQWVQFLSFYMENLGFLCIKFPADFTVFVFFSWKALVSQGVVFLVAFPFCSSQITNSFNTISL